MKSGLPSTKNYKTCLKKNPLEFPKPDFQFKSCLLPRQRSAGLPMLGELWLLASIGGFRWSFMWDPVFHYRTQNSVCRDKSNRSLIKVAGGRNCFFTSNKLIIKEQNRPNFKTQIQKGRKPSVFKLKTLSHSTPQPAEKFHLILALPFTAKHHQKSLESLVPFSLTTTVFLQQHWTYSAKAISIKQNTEKYYYLYWIGFFILVVVQQFQTLLIALSECIITF